MAIVILCRLVLYLARFCVCYYGQTERRKMTYLGTSVTNFSTLSTIKVFFRLIAVGNVAFFF